MASLEIRRNLISGKPVELQFRENYGGIAQIPGTLRPTCINLSQILNPIANSRSMSYISSPTTIDVSEDRQYQAYMPVASIDGREALSKRHLASRIHGPESA